MAVVGEERVPARRRRRWPWIVATCVVVALLVLAAVLGEILARGFVIGGIRAAVVTALKLPATATVEVDVPGPILPQLAVGSLGLVRIDIADAPLGPTTGDVVVVVRDQRIWGGGMEPGTASSGGEAIASFDAAEVQALVDASGSASGTVALAEPDVSLTTQLSAFGVTIPAGLALTVGATDGDLVLHPASVTLAGAEVSLDAVRARFGRLADPLLGDRTLCLKDRLPTGAVLESARVEGDRLVTAFALDPNLLADPALQQPGTC